MIVLYFVISRKTKNYINVLFLVLLFQGVLIIFLNCFRLIENGAFFTIRKGDIILITYFLLSYLGIFLMEYRNIYKRHIKNFAINHPNKTFIWLFVLIIIGFWLINNDQLILAISNPRMFYANTRIGGGIIYYIIIPLTVFVYFYFVTKIRYKRTKKVSYILSIGVSTALICLFVYIFGQKSSFATIGVLFLSTIYFKGNKESRNKLLFTLGFSFALVCVGVFVLYSRQQGIEVNGILSSLARYSDYIVNFNDLVDIYDNYKYGKILFENEFYSYIPRFIWEGKPELFGSLALGLEVPRLVDWAKSLTGAPSFGPLGPAYGDFGVFAVVIKCAKDWIFAYFAIGFERKLTKNYNFWDHFLFLTFSGVVIFSLTLTAIPLYQLLVIFILYKFTAHKKYSFEVPIYALVN